MGARPLSHGWHGNALFYRRGTVLRAERLHLPHAEPRGAVLAEGNYEEVSNNPQVMEAYMGTTDGELQGAH